MGFLWGMQIGLLAGSVLFPTQLPTIYGPRLEDLRTTQAELGGAVPIVYGTIAVPGTVIYLSCVLEQVETEEVGGKGAPEQTITTYSYYQDIALGLCEGPIGGVLRIWENGILKYDIRPQQATETAQDYADRMEASSDYERRFNLYLGDEGQEPEPIFEAAIGVNEVPAFRGLAYIVYPLKQLLDENGRRHPQFKFEVFTGTSQRVVLPPIAMDGVLDGYQLPYVVPWWSANRYYTIDLIGTEGLRVFDVMTNEELAQITFIDDLGLAPWLLFLTATTGPDGVLYLCGAISLDVLRLYAITTHIFPTIPPFDPIPPVYSVDYVDFTAAGEVPERQCVVRHVGTLEVTDFMFTQGIFGAFSVRRLTPTPGITELLFDYPQAEGLVVDGYRNGTNSFAYGLTWTSVSSGTGPGIDVYRLHIDETFDNILLRPVPLLTLELIATIPLSTLDPACTRLQEVSGLVFDQASRALIFNAVGYGPGTTPADRLFECYFKYDPEAHLILWRSADLVGPNYDGLTQLSRLRGDHYGVVTGLNSMAYIDTRTGEHTVIDFPEVPGLFDGQQMFNSTNGTMISFSVGGPYVVMVDRRVPGAVSVGDIVSDVCTRCGLDDTEIVVDDLMDRNVSGYAVARTAPGRGIIEPLRQVAFFDMVESDGKLKFPTRGGPLALTIPEDDLGAHFADEDRVPLVATNKIQDVELPKRIRLQYLAESRDYEPGDAPSPTRISSAAVNEVDIQCPISITDDQAVQSAEVLWSDAWGSRWTYEIALEVAYLGLDPTDVIGIPVDGRIYRARIIAIDDSAGLLRRMTLMRDDDGTYVSTAVADPPLRPRLSVVSYSPTALLLLDLPPLRDADNDAGIYAAAYPVMPNRTWAGAVIHRSSDGGATYGQIGSIATRGIVGKLTGALASGLSTTWDFENVLEVDMISGTLESRTQDAVLNGANMAVVGAYGRWEIIQFLTATQISATRWQLSGLLRGRRATEHHVGTSIAQDFFVMLSAGGLTRLPMQISEIGAARVYRAVTFGTSSVESTAQSFTGQGEALRPFSPVHIHGERVAGDLIIEWTRRGRLGQELRSGTDIPLSEESEAYEIDILIPGASPELALRTLESSTTSVTYTAADQTTDGFDADDQIMVRVYQMSATVGRGTAGEAIL